MWRIVTAIVIGSRRDDDEPGDVHRAKQNWDPLLEMRERQVSPPVLAFAERDPFRAPVGRSRQPFLQRADDLELGGVQLNATAEEMPQNDP